MFAQPLRRSKAECRKLAISWGFPSAMGRLAPGDSQFAVELWR
jgi:hypothetical protein